MLVSILLYPCTSVSYLALCHCPQGFDDRQLSLQIWGIV
jgi:hypothetical protein